jgi:hypothetical protein
MKSFFSIVPKKTFFVFIRRKEKTSLLFGFVAKSFGQRFVDQSGLVFAAVFHNVVDYRASMLFVKRAQWNKVAVTSFRRLATAGVSSCWVSVEKSHKIISLASWVVGVFITSSR